jgi:hypothetical protein
VDNLLEDMASRSAIEAVLEGLKGPNENGPQGTDELWNLDL